ncbi:hypothetical protein B0I21_1118 [Sphingobacterium paludis]|uniref:Uncharacterized protein n=2 Tax=Sphingobacterium paludis TaxID=1476465 RepID=A0A4R7CV15_9SPHI|nr:hypothetical protein B0I21_1118 [Sphingobacterium paludis]
MQSFIACMFVFATFSCTKEIEQQLSNQTSTEPEFDNVLLTGSTGMVHQNIGNQYKAPQ